MLVRIGNANDVADRQMRVFEVAGNKENVRPIRSRTIQGEGADLLAETWRRPPGRVMPQSPPATNREDRSV